MNLLLSLLLVFQQSLPVGVSTNSTSRVGPRFSSIGINLITTTPTALPAAINPSCQSLGDAGGTSTPISTIGANFIWISVGHFSSGATLTDSLGNTWVPLTSYDIGGVVKTQGFYSQNPTVGAAHTFTYSGGVADYVGMCILPLSGMATASVLDSGTDSGAVLGLTTCSPGPITPSSGVKVVITTIADTDTFSIDSSYTLDAQVALIAAISYGVSVAHLIQTPNGALTNPQWSSSGASACGIAAFKGQ